MKHWQIPVFMLSTFAGIFLAAWVASSQLHIDYWIALIGSCLVAGALSNIAWKIVMREK